MRLRGLSGGTALPSWAEAAGCSGWQTALTANAPASVKNNPNKNVGNRLCGLWFDNMEVTPARSAELLAARAGHWRQRKSNGRSEADFVNGTAVGDAMAKGGVEREVVTDLPDQTKQARQRVRATDLLFVED